MHKRKYKCQTICIRDFTDKWKVENALSDMGKSMMPILQSFCKWGMEHMPADWE